MKLASAVRAREHSPNPKDSNVRFYLPALTGLLLLPAARAQGIGLELSETVGPFPSTVGSVCVPVSCAITPQSTLTTLPGSSVNVTVFGAPGQIYFLGVGTVFTCQTIPSIQNQLAIGLGSPIVSVGGVLPSAGFVCSGTVAGTSIFGVSVPASLPSGSQFVFQALTVDAQSSSFAFTSPVRLAVN